MTKILTILIILSTQFLACSKKEHLVSKQEMFEKARASGEKIELVIPSGIDKGIHCTDYGEGCLGGHTIRVGRLEMIVVEYDSEDHARKAAKAIKGMYAVNWLFDDVADEPILKKFVENTYGATKAE